MMRVLTQSRARLGFSHPRLARPCVRLILWSAAGSELKRKYSCEMTYCRLQLLSCCDDDDNWRSQQHQHYCVASTHVLLSADVAAAAADIVAVCQTPDRC